MTKNTRFETIQDMVDFAVEHHYSDARYLLESRSEMEFVDEEAGKVWTEEANALPWINRYNNPNYEAEIEKEREVHSRKPEQKRVTYWWLRENNGYKWHAGNTIELSNELGEALDKTWKKKPRWHGSNDMENTGYVGLQTILKRLGARVKKEVDAAKAKAKAESERKHRNYVREQAKELAKKLLELKAKNPTMFFPQQLEEIAAMEMEE